MKKTLVKRVLDKKIETRSCIGSLRLKVSSEFMIYSKSMRRSAWNPFVKQLKLTMRSRFCSLCHKKIAFEIESTSKKQGRKPQVIPLTCVESWGKTRSRVWVHGLYHAVLKTVLDFSSPATCFLSNSADRNPNTLKVHLMVPWVRTRRT